MQKAVLGLRESQEIHDLEAFGLIDRDDRRGENVEELADNGIFALKVYSVEALYYCSDAIVAVAHEQAKLRGEDEIELIELAKQRALEVLKNHAEEMAVRRCERQIHERVLSQIPSRKSIIANPTQPIYLSIDSLYLNELKHFNELVQNEKLDKLIVRYPVRESRTLVIIARTLKCLNKNDYEQIVITQIRRDNDLAEKLKKRIGTLSETLDQIENPKIT